MVITRPTCFGSLTLAFVVACIMSCSTIKTFLSLASFEHVDCDSLDDSLLKLPCISTVNNGDQDQGSSALALCLLAGGKLMKKKSSSRGYNRLNYLRILQISVQEIVRVGQAPFLVLRHRIMMFKWTAQTPLVIQILMTSEHFLTEKTENMI